MLFEPRTFQHSFYIIIYNNIQRVVEPLYIRIFNVAEALYIRILTFRGAAVILLNGTPKEGDMGLI